MLGVGGGWGASKAGAGPGRGASAVLASPKERVLLNCTRQWGKSKITAAKAVHHAYTYDGGYWRVPKRDLIVGLQVLLQRGGLRIAAGMTLGPVLVQEMAAMQVRQKPAGHEQFGA